MSEEIMPKRTRARQSGATLLEQAIAVLIQNQAAFLSQVPRTDRELSRIERENSQRFSRIETELEQIRNILVRHEAIINDLPEAILNALLIALRKIGFKPTM